MWNEHSKRYVTLIESINKLYERSIDIQSLSDKKNFYACIDTVSTNYSDVSYDEKHCIDLYTDGQLKDIIIDDARFSYQVKATTKQRSGYMGPDSNFTIEGIWSNGEEFSFRFQQILQLSHDLVLNIVYAIIVLSVSQSIPKAEAVWTFLRKSEYRRLIGKRLSAIEDILPIARTIIAKYPFMRHIFDEALVEQTNCIKKDLESLDILNPNYTF